MSLSKEQHQAYQAIQDWLAATEKKTFRSGGYGDDWMFALQGYAGTGKTYLLGFIIQDLCGMRVHCAAPTGKAASVLMSKLGGTKEVVTLHRLLYCPVDEDIRHLRLLMDQLKADPENKELAAQVEEEQKALSEKAPGFSRKDNSDVQPGDLVIVDEASMVDKRVRDDLKATGCRALFVGDPGQLPPVNDDGWFIKAEPDALLETIQRQALDNPIIRFSMEIREGMAKPRDWRKREGCGIWNKEDVDPKTWLDWDQVITGTNASRHKVNRFFRQALGRSKRSFLPVAGEKLICLKNDYDRMPQFINGTIFEATSGTTDAADGENHNLDILYEGRDLSVTYYGHHCLSHYKEGLRELPRDFRKGLMELDFAYAITCHKSQGSEWPKVIIADDKMKIDDMRFRRRWLYTAVTRAKEELMIIQ